MVNKKLIPHGSIIKVSILIIKKMIVCKSLILIEGTKNHEK